MKPADFATRRAPEQSDGVGSIPGRTPALERHDKGSCWGDEVLTPLFRHIVVSVESEPTLGLTLSCASFLCFDLLFSTVKLICILHNRSKSLLRMRSGALLGGFLEAHNLASSYP